MFLYCFSFSKIQNYGAQHRIIFAELRATVNHFCWPVLATFFPLKKTFPPACAVLQTPTYATLHTCPHWKWNISGLNRMQ